MPDAARADAPNVDEAVAELEAAAEQYDRTRERVRDVGEREVDRVADAYERVERVLDGYEERATDWDDFEGYIEFREEISSVVEALPEDLPHREAFTEADEMLKTGGVSETLSEADFERARDRLGPAREMNALREEWRAVHDRYREARRAVLRRRDDLADRVADLDRLVRLGEADLDAPVQHLRDPIAAYNEAVTAAFAAFKREASARAVLSFVERTDVYPLVDYRQPPARLLRYVRETDAGTESVPQLLEYADYSRSKLSHYVDDAQALKAAVGTNRTYLDRLDAGPLTVAWPPVEADELRYRIRELVPVVARLDAAVEGLGGTASSAGSVVERLRSVRELADDAGYTPLRESALAREELSAAERDRLAAGDVAADLAAAREDLNRVEAALDEHPPVDELD